ncbi:DUF368 domain-containing protein [Arsukibacterium sp.]|uniref:DUF368 domain-containing protein n=1 Tax=Arsukibacterium sp. TaxID=1977258 RepID=UPI002FDB41BB
MNYLQWIIKGLAMGAADVVPGVSGGTLAFVLGIYHRLLAAISSVNLAALRLLFSGRLKQCWQHIDGTFLLCLLSGILISVFSLANLIGYLMEYRPVPLWAFFNGLILTALPPLFKAVSWSVWRALLFVFGISFALAIGMLTPVQLEPAGWMFFAAGAIAICAMILPGVSGSFMLLIMGMYAPVLLAVKEFQFGVLLLFVSGCVIGLMSFTRLLNWLLSRYMAASLALLTGIVVGAMYRIWPWQQQQQVYSPWQYAEQVAPADGLLAIASFLSAVLLMTALLNLNKWLNPA